MDNTVVGHINDNKLIYIKVFFCRSCYKYNCPSVFLSYSCIVIGIVFIFGIDLRVSLDLSYTTGTTTVTVTVTLCFK